MVHQSFVVHLKDSYNCWTRHMVARPHFVSNYLLNMTNYCAILTSFEWSEINFKWFVSIAVEFILQSSCKISHAWIIFLDSCNVNWLCWHRDQNRRAVMKGNDHVGHLENPMLICRTCPGKKVSCGTYSSCYVKLSHESQCNCTVICHGSL